MVKIFRGTCITNLNVDGIGEVRRKARIVGMWKRLFPTVSTVQ